MANTNAPHGLRPIGHLDGAMWRIEEHNKVVGYATAIFINDAVNRVADGSIEASATPGTTRYSGVALNHGAASTATVHLVLTDPRMVFEAQDDNDTDGIAAADLGLNANLVLTAGDATTLVSKHQIDESTVNTTATLDVKLLKLYAASDNAHGANARIEIIFNKHRYNPEVAGV